MSAVLLNSTLAIKFGNQLLGEPRFPSPPPQKRKDVGTKNANLTRLSLESSLCSSSADLAELPSVGVSFKPSLDGDGKDQGRKNQGLSECKACFWWWAIAFSQNAASGKFLSPTVFFFIIIIIKEPCLHIPQGYKDCLEVCGLILAYWNLKGQRGGCWVRVLVVTDSVSCIRLWSLVAVNKQMCSSFHLHLLLRQQN